MPGLRQAAMGGLGDAESKAITTADGPDTHGVVNRHPDYALGGSSQSASSKPNTDGSSSLLASSSSSSPGSQDKEDPWRFRVGISEDRNKRWRRTMEDSHAFVYDFGGVHGQGFFAIFDGHAGKHAAEWCGSHFHKYLIDCLITRGESAPVPDLLNDTFHNVDAKLSQLASEQGSSSGCTAVTCFLRLEDEGGKPLAHSKTGGINPQLPRRLSSSGGASAPLSEQDDSASPEGATSAASEVEAGSPKGSSSSSRLFSSFAKRIRKGSSGSETGSPEKSGQAQLPDGDSAPTASQVDESGTGSQEGQDGLVKIPNKAKVRRVLYTANVGDARAVLCRKGSAVRLTYDHKASDAQEAKRITDAGGFVMNNRVNAVLAVTRSLGDSAMKEFVVGAPYTTETTLTEDDDFLIVACDGLWDVVDDQDAVTLVKDIQDPQEASAKLLAHALENFSTDNTSVMVIRFRVDGTVFSGSSSTNKTSSSVQATGEASASGSAEKSGPAAPVVDDESVTAS